MKTIVYDSATKLEAVSLFHRQLWRCYGDQLTEYSKEKKRLGMLAVCQIRKSEKFVFSKLEVASKMIGGEVEYLQRPHMKLRLVQEDFDEILFFCEEISHDLNLVMLNEKSQRNSNASAEQV